MSAIHVRIGVSLAVLGSIACSDETKPRTTPSVDDAATVLDASVESGVPDATPGGDAGDAGPPQGPRDRAGRPFVSRWLVAPGNRDIVAEVEEPFRIDELARAKGTPALVGVEMTTRLSTIDGFDGKADFTSTSSSHEMMRFLLNDGLVVDPTKPFSPSSYLDIEANGATHATCGGRWIADDALDKTLSYLVSKKLTGFSDGVDAPAAMPSETFPYLAAPH